MKRKIQAGAWLRWFVPLLVVVGALVADESTDEAQAVRQLKSEFENLEKAVGASDLEDTAKQGIVGLLDDVEARLEQALNYQEQADEPGAAEPVPQGVIEDLEASLAALPTADELLGQPPEDTAELRVRLETDRAELEAVSRKLEEKERELDRLKELPVRVGARLPEAEAELSEKKALLAARAEPSADSLKALAERLSLKVEIQALEAEIRWLGVERSGHPSREKVATLERQILRERQSRLKETVGRLEGQLNEQMRSEVDRLRDEVAALVEGAPDGPIREMAEELTELVDGLAKAAQMIESTADRSESTSRKLDNLERESQRVRQQVKVGGQEGAYSQVFLDRRRRLADPRGLDYEAREVEQELSDAQLASFRLEDLEEEQARLVKRWQGKNEALPILKMREELLGRLLRNQRALIRDLARLSSDKRAYENLTKEFGRFLSEQLFLSRSSKPIGIQFFKDLPSSFTWVFSREHLSQLGHSLRGIPLRHPFVTALVTLVFVFLLVIRSRLRKSIENSARRIRRISTDRMVHTIRALFESMLIALPVPILLAFIAWALANQPWSDAWVRGLGIWLGWAAFALTWVFGMRELARPEGVGVQHFGWDKASSKVLRHSLGLIALFYLPLVLFAGLTVFDSNPAYFDSLGRLGFLGAQAVMAWAFWRMFHPDSGVFADLIRDQPHRLLSKGRHLWLAFPAGLPLVFAVMTALGFSLTAMILSEVFHNCMRWIAVAVVVYGLLLRWFTIKSRKIALQERIAARMARRAEADEESDEASEQAASEEEIAEMDLDVVAKQTRRLLRSLVGIGALVVMAYTSMAMLPLDNFSGLGTGAGFTWLGLLKAILIGAVGLTVVRNLPGLLDLMGMRESGVAPGIRYAVATLCQYAVGALALFLITQALAVDWSKFGWIAAALSVGLGFGLQEIVANFVCGIIILFERPVRVGDVVTVGDVTGTVSRIRMRATTITNWERQEFVVPNKDFITGSLINWTLSNPVNRITLEVGVAYGTDTAEARQILTEIAEAHPVVLDDPGPLINFETFGDSTLNLSMRCYLPNMDNRMRIVTELNEEVDRRFKEAGIEIAFPQQDLHIRSLPERADVVLKTESKEQD